MTGLNALLVKYVEVFDENFPVMAYTEYSDEELCDIVSACLQSGKKAEVKLSPGAVY